MPAPFRFRPPAFLLTRLRRLSLFAACLLILGLGVAAVAPAARPPRPTCCATATSRPAARRVDVLVRATRW